MNVEKRAEEYNIGAVINLDNFSSYAKLLRVTARIMQFKTEKIMKAIGKQPTAQQMRNSVDQAGPKRYFIK